MAAETWAVFVTVLGIYWWTGGAGFPFGRNDRTGPDSASLLTGLDAGLGAPLITGFGVLSVVVAGLLHSSRRRSRALAGSAVALAVAIVGLVVDSRMITLLPPLGLYPINWISADWPTVFQAVTALGAALFVIAAVANMTPTRGRRSSWIRVGKVATYVAMVSPMPYAVIRLAWSQGWALGAPAPFVEATLRNQPENRLIEPVLASFAIGGAVLTYGLLCRWGRNFPRWIPFVRGRQVPLWFPLLLGGSAVVGIFGFGRGTLQGRLGLQLPGAADSFQLWGQPIDDSAYWGADGLGWFFFPLWAISLAVALAGYYHRYRSALDNSQDECHGAPAL
ncbi:hypothetical protein GCM10028799_83690 [Kribbella italica]